MKRLRVKEEFTKHPFLVSVFSDEIKTLSQGKPHSIVTFPRRENFWTVGAASYKDKPSRTQHEFEDLVRLTNAAMQFHFFELYEFQLEWFSFHFKQKFQYMPNMPLPGFHVFRYCEEFEQPLARAHVDVPFNNFAWGRQVGYDQIFTHVVAVEVPTNAGMYVWDITADDIDREGLDVVKERIRTTRPDDIVYHEKDKMVIHSGRFAHQIIPFTKDTGEWRITLQSHAVLIDGVWNLYW